MCVFCVCGLELARESWVSVKLHKILPVLADAADKVGTLETCFRNIYGSLHFLKNDKIKKNHNFLVFKIPLQRAHQRANPEL